jgi:hypothetical protein
MAAFIALLLMGVVAFPASAQLAAGATPAGRFYSGAAGFEGFVHLDWQPAFLEGSVPGLAFSVGGGYSYLSSDGMTTNGAVVAAGAGYYFPLGYLEFYARPGVLAGVQYSSFSGVDANSETPFMLAPEAEVGYAWPSGLRASLYGAFRMLFYQSDAAEGNERSLTLGPRISFAFGG